VAERPPNAGSAAAALFFQRATPKSELTFAAQPPQYSTAGNVTPEIRSVDDPKSAEGRVTEKKRK
jgi:hypothetical protein